ncbi:MAG: SAM-dependent methyltransferase [Bryobacterales bacterium]|nr:SAM-dependent methyltransferase [Bryobacterales bacterium]
MTPLEELLRELVLREGPIPFRRFMELALYHPEYGYYRCGRDPFGRSGDFFTAEQLQPVYGFLMAAAFAPLYEELGEPPDFAVVELGAGRAEMAPAFARWRYVPVEFGRASLPETITGVVLANEFFDALPVDLAVRREAGWRLMRVDWNGERFVWQEAEPAEGAVAEYLERHVPVAEEGALAEVHLEALAWVERIAQRLERGFLVVVDYGYTEREHGLFARGTLMSYRRHRACEDVLAGPGERDITALVPFTALERHAAACGLHTVRLERLARFLLEAAGRAPLEALLAEGSEAERLRRRLQWKTLLLAFGESFRVLVSRKREQGRRGNEKGPEGIGA